MKELSLGELGRRLLHLIVSLFILLCVTFVIGRVMPTDPVGAIVGELADPKAYEAMRVRLGLDLPLYQQFFVYVWGLLHGDMGTAILTGNAVTKDLSQAFPATLELATLAVLISTLIGVPSAWQPAFSGIARSTSSPASSPWSDIRSRSSGSVSWGWSSSMPASIWSVGQAASMSSTKA